MAQDILGTTLAMHARGQREGSYDSDAFQTRTVRHSLRRALSLDCVDGGLITQRLAVQRCFPLRSKRLPDDPSFRIIWRVDAQDMRERWRNVYQIHSRSPFRFHHGISAENEGCAVRGKFGGGRCQSPMNGRK